MVKWQVIPENARQVLIATVMSHYDAIVYFNSQQACSAPLLDARWIDNCAQHVHSFFLIWRSDS